MATGNGHKTRDERVEPYVADHASFLAESVLGGAPNLAPLRKEGIARFAEMGFPSPRDEEWRFTNVSPLAERRFHRPGPAERVDLAAAAAAIVPGAYALVFVDGHFVPTLSSAEGLPGGAVAVRLQDALVADAAEVLGHLGRYASSASNPFAALNTAFVNDGAYVRVPRNTALERPIQIVHLSSGGGEAGEGVTYPRTLVVLEESAEATVVETFAALRPGATFSCAVTEIVVGDNASLDHTKLQQEDTDAFHVATMQFQQGRDSVVRSHNISVGAGLSRTDVNAILDGDGVDCTLNGLYLASGTQHVDTHMRVEHVRPHGGSHELYKGILDGRARAVFNGRIYVHQEAQKTDAKQSNRNLLLSREALVNSNPQLEIFADDVKCTHGSTVGQLDAEAVFYLRSRGIDEEAARSLLIYAFAGDVLEGLRVPALRERVEATLRDRLPRGDIVHELA